MAKRITPKEAEAIRNSKIDTWSGIDCNVRPTKGVNSGINGLINEMNNCQNSNTKTKIGKRGKGDNFLEFTDNGKVVHKWVESKLNDSEMDRVLTSLSKGKDGIIIYTLNVCNSNTSYKTRAVTPRIMRYSTFVSLLNACGALRTNKPNGKGGTKAGIQHTKAKLPALLEKMTEYNPLEIMDVNAIH